VGYITLVLKSCSIPDSAVDIYVWFWYLSRNTTINGREGNGKGAVANYRLDDGKDDERKATLGGGNERVRGR
jgi:hypothetical protein